MKRFGLLLTLLIIARITIAQTVAKNEVSQQTEQEIFMESHFTGSVIFDPSIKTAIGKKYMISSAARKSSLLANGNSKTPLEKTSIKETYDSAQARKPATAGKPPRIAMWLIPPPGVRKFPVISIPHKRVMPFNGKF